MLNNRVRIGLYSKTALILGLLFASPRSLTGEGRVPTSGISDSRWAGNPTLEGDRSQKLSKSKAEYLMPTFSVNISTGSPDEGSSVTIDYPMMRCSNGDVPLYDGLLVWGSTPRFPPGLSAVLLLEVRPYKAILDGVNALTNFQAMLNVWCGSDKIGEMHQTFSRLETPIRDFVDVQVKVIEGKFFVEFSSERIEKELAYTVTMCPSGVPTSTEHCLPADKLQKSSKMTERFEFNPLGRLGRYTMKFFAGQQDDDSDRKSECSMVIDNTPEFMPIGVGGHLEDIYAKRFAEVQPLQIEFEYYRSEFVVYVRLSGYECLKYGGPKAVEFVFARHGVAKIYVRSNLLLKPHSPIRLLTRRLGETERIHAIGTLTCVEGPAIDVGVVIGPLGPENLTASHEAQSPHMDRISFEPKTIGGDATVTIRYPPVSDCGEHPVRYRGIGTPKKEGPGLHTYESPRIELDSPGSVDTFNDLDFWTTYVITAAAFCRNRVQPVATYIGEFYTGPGRLQDIEQLSVDIIDGHVFASILTMRYNFTGEVTFKLTLCEDYDDKNAQCQDVLAARSQARTLVQLRVRPIMKYVLTVTPKGVYNRETFYGRTISVAFTTEPCNKECLDSLKGGEGLRPISRRKIGSKLSFVQMIQPNPCRPVRKENISLEYSTENGDHRGFMAVNARQYNLIGLRLEDFKRGTIVRLKMTVSCANFADRFHFADAITTGSRPLDPADEYDYTDIEPRRPTEVTKVRFMMLDERQDGSYELRFVLPLVGCYRVQRYEVTVCDCRLKCIARIVDRHSSIGFVHLNETAVLEVTVRPLEIFSQAWYQPTDDPHLSMTLDNRPSTRLTEEIRQDSRTVELDLRLIDSTTNSTSIMISFSEDSCRAFHDASAVRYVSLSIQVDNGRNRRLVAEIQDPTVTSIVVPNFPHNATITLIGKVVCQREKTNIDLLYRGVYAFGMIRTHIQKLTNHDGDSRDHNGPSAG